MVCSRAASLWLLGSAGITSAADAVSNVSSCIWRPVAETPMLTLGSLFTGASWNDPSSKMIAAARPEDATAPTRVMYASANDLTAQPFEPVRVYRLVTTKAEPTSAADWRLEPPTPVLAPVLPYTGCETPDVVVTKDGVHHMFITTYQGTPPGAATNFTIGHALSRDGGLSFNLLTSTLVSPTKVQTDWNGDIVGEPAPALMPNGDLHLYFTAVGVSLKEKAAVQSIGLIISKDNGRSFSSPQQVIVPDQSLWPLSKGYVGYSTPSAAVGPDGILHLFSDVASNAPDPLYGPGNNWLQVALQHSWSIDGLTFHQDRKPLLVRDSFKWTAREIRSPAPTFHKNLLGGYTLWVRLLPLVVNGPAVAFGNHSDASLKAL